MQQRGTGVFMLRNSLGSLCCITSLVRGTAFGAQRTLRPGLSAPANPACYQLLRASGGTWAAVLSPAPSLHCPVHLSAD